MSFPPSIRAESSYSAAVRKLHWTMAAVIFAAIALGIWREYLPRGELRAEVMLVHKSLGATAFALLLVRIAARVASGAPPYVPPLGRLNRWAAATAHAALYGLMLAMPVSGYLTSVAGGHGVSYFGLFLLPELAPRSHAIDEAASKAHYLFAILIGIALAAHVGAALWHRWVRRDGVFARMWPAPAR